MNLLLFLVMLAASFVVVRLGALAFHLTGLDWAASKFQALSCFTGTGFTTRESEQITEHPQRRRIATILIVSGNLGLVTLIATFANSIRAAPLSGIGAIPAVRDTVPASWMPFLNLAIIALLSYGMTKLYFNRKVLDRLTGFLQKWFLKSFYRKRLQLIRLIVFSGNTGVARVEITTDSAALGRSLGSLGDDLLVLSLERDGKDVHRPAPETVVLKGDKLVCFGGLNDIKTALLDPCRRPSSTPPS